MASTWSPDVAQCPLAHRSPQALPTAHCGQSPSSVKTSFANSLLGPCVANSVPRTPPIFTQSPPNSPQSVPADVFSCPASAASVCPPGSVSGLWVCNSCPSPLECVFPKTRARPCLTALPRSESRKRHCCGLTALSAFLRTLPSFLPVPSTAEETTASPGPGPARGLCVLLRGLFCAFDSETIPCPWHPDVLGECRPHFRVQRPSV